MTEWVVGGMDVAGPWHAEVATALGQIVFSGGGDTPGELLSTIAQMRQALDALEARYADMIAKNRRTAAAAAGEAAPAPAPRKRGRKPGSANGTGRRGRTERTPAPLPFGEPTPAPEA